MYPLSPSYVRAQMQLTDSKRVADASSSNDICKTTSLTVSLAHSLRALRPEKTWV